MVFCELDVLRPDGEQEQLVRGFHRPSQGKRAQAEQEVHRKSHLASQAAPASGSVRSRFGFRHIRGNRRPKIVDTTCVWHPVENGILDSIHELFPRDRPHILLPLLTLPAQHISSPEQNKPIQRHAFQSPRHQSYRVRRNRELSNVGGVTCGQPVVEGHGQGAEMWGRRKNATYQ